MNELSERDKMLRMINGQRKLIGKMRPIISQGIYRLRRGGGMMKLSDLSEE